MLGHFFSFSSKSASQENLIRLTFETNLTYEKNATIYHTMSFRDDDQFGKNFLLYITLFLGLSLRFICFFFLVFASFCPGNSITFFGFPTLCNHLVSCKNSKESFTRSLLLFSTFSVPLNFKKAILLPVLKVFSSFCRCFAKP